MATNFFVGLDVGQAGEYTACAVLERTLEDNPPCWHYAVRHLERFPLGTPHAQVLAWLRGRTRVAPLNGAMLVVDQTSVGRPVVDAFRRADLPVVLRPLAVAWGLERSYHAGCYHVPKRELASVLQLALQERRLHVCMQLPQAATLCEELLAFRPKVRAVREDDVESWRERPHDDLVLAVAIALWMAERERPAVAEAAVEAAYRRPAWWEDEPGWVNVGEWP